MKSRTVTDENAKLLKELMTGKYLQLSISDVKRAELAQALGLPGKYAGSSIYSQAKKLEEMGVIVGFIPVVSEEGGRLLRAIEAFRAMNGKKPGENKEPLTEALG